MIITDLWQAVLGELELSMSKANFTTWFRKTSIISFENEEVIVAVPNDFTKSWLEKKYHRLILESLQRSSQKRIRKIEYRIEGKKGCILEDEKDKQIHTPPSTSSEMNPVASTAPTTSPHQTPSPYLPSLLNPRYRFQSFVVGKQNELAHAAALAVSNQPGGVYNPLFIYGGVGLGKTHLLQAIGNELLQQNPQARVLYVTCETFTNEFITAVRSGKGKEFKERYRGVDLLLVDDIQFITGKEGTQEEFFHTFNQIHQNNRQIVMTSDRPPKSIPELESRLVSRFECGMLADVGIPDFETRVAILETKCREKDLSTPPIDALHAIASSVQHNVRELEGALNKVIALHQFQHIPITGSSVRAMLGAVQEVPEQIALTQEHIIKSISEFYQIALEDLLGKSREKRFSHPRQVTMYLLREELHSSYPMIGDFLGGRDHTTVMHACDKIASTLAEDERLQNELVQIRKLLEEQVRYTPL